MSRYSHLSEKTYRRHYSQPFAFVEFNQHTISAAIAANADCISVMDCSFIPKSGKNTYGLDWFYNGSASRSEKGLEISVIAVVDVAAHRRYTLSVQQTPPTSVSAPSKGKANKQGKGKGGQGEPPANSSQTFSREHIERICEQLKQLPERPQSSQTAEQPAPPTQLVEPDITRIDHYLKQLNQTHPYFRHSALPTGTLNISTKQWDLQKL